MPWAIPWKRQVGANTLENSVWVSMLHYPESKHAGFGSSFCHWKLLTIPAGSVMSSAPFLLYLHSVRSIYTSMFQRHHGFAGSDQYGFLHFIWHETIQKTVNLSLQFSSQKFFTFRTWWFLRKDMEEQSSFITVCGVLRFISHDYGWQFTCPLLSGLTIYIIWFPTRLIKNYVMSFAKTLQPPIRCFQFSFPQFSWFLIIFLYYRTQQVLIFCPDLTHHSYTILLTSSSFAVFLSPLFISPLAQFSHNFKISLFFCRISYTWIFPTLNIFMICLINNFVSLTRITFTLVLN